MSYRLQNVLLHKNTTNGYVISCRDRKAAARRYLQTGEQLDELSEEWQEDESDEAGLTGWFGHFVSVHERGHWKTFEFLCVALHRKNRSILLAI